jgi:hypothetical protein
VHSRYGRRLLDTAVGGSEVVICLTVRRFLCTAPECAKVTFAEQVDGLTSTISVYAAKTRALVTEPTTIDGDDSGCPSSVLSLRRSIPR